MPNPPIGNIAVKHNLVYLNDRLSPDSAGFYDIPTGKLFVVTDIVVQNRAPGDTPVSTTQFTRFAVTSPAGDDVFFDVVGNATLSQHFTTGLPISNYFRFLNAVNSNAPFVEFHITGLLRDV